MIMNPNDARTAIAHLDALRKFLEPFAIEWINPLDPMAEFVIDDVLVLPGERYADVVVRLRQPVKYQVRATANTSNGTAVSSTVAQNWSYYVPTTMDMIFRPGETAKVMRVPLHRNLEGKYFNASINHSVNQPPLDPTTAKVRQVASRPVVAVEPQPVIEPIDPKEGLSLVYSTDFIEQTWDDRAGFWQSGNREAAMYCNAVKQPGFDPHPIEPVDGLPRRKLRMKRMDVEYRDGSNVTKLRYRAPMLNSGDVFQFKHGDYIELDCIMPVGTGGVPAFWAVIGNPYAEIDMEFGLGGYPGLADTVHYELPDKSQPAQGVRTTYIPNGEKVTLGIFRGNQAMVFYVDNVEVSRRIAMFEGRDMPVIINNTTGGVLRSDPNWPLGKTEDIVLFEFRAYRRDAQPA